MSESAAVLFLDGPKAGEVEALPLSTSRHTVRLHEMKSALALSGPQEEPEIAPYGYAVYDVHWVTMVTNSGRDYYGLASCQLRNASACVSRLFELAVSGTSDDPPHR